MQEDVIGEGGFFSRKHFVKAKLFALSASIALGLGSMACANAQVLQKGLSGDAEFISRHYSLPLADVQRQLRLQNSRENLVGDLREEFKGRLAGIYVEHYPVDRIIVRLTGNLHVPGRELQIGNDALKIDFMHGQEHSTAFLENTINSNWNELRRVFPELQGAGTDDRAGEVVLHIYVLDTSVKKTDEMRVLAQDILKVPVRINAVPSRVEDFFQWWIFTRAIRSFIGYSNVVENFCAICGYHSGTWSACFSQGAGRAGSRFHQAGSPQQGRAIYFSLCRTP